LLFGNIRVGLLAGNDSLAMLNSNEHELKSDDTGYPWLRDRICQRFDELVNVDVPSSLVSKIPRRRRRVILRDTGKLKMLRTARSRCRRYHIGAVEAMLRHLFFGCNRRCIQTMSRHRAELSLLRCRVGAKVSSLGVASRRCQLIPGGGWGTCQQGFLGEIGRQDSRDAAMTSRAVLA
jgi:hypothetical protein